MQGFNPVRVFRLLRFVTSRRGAGDAGGQGGRDAGENGGAM